jgi:hypothetical protein
MLLLLGSFIWLKQHLPFHYSRTSIQGIMLKVGCNGFANLSPLALFVYVFREVIVNTSLVLFLLVRYDFRFVVGSILLSSLGSIVLFYHPDYLILGV